MPPPKHGKKRYEVHLEVTRLERHAIFRRSISLDDVDCFDTLKSQTYQWHEFITLLFQGLRGPFRVVLKRASCQNRFCATSSNESALRYCPVAILRPSRYHTRPSRGPLAALPKVAFLKDVPYKSALFSLHCLKGFQSRSDDCFMPKCVFCTTSSIQSHFHNCIVSTLGVNTDHAEALLRPPVENRIVRRHRTGATFFLQWYDTYISIVLTCVCR